jgi:RHO1 GDP-GTP exchange protein 1/2
LIYAPDEQAVNTLRGKNTRHLVKKTSFTRGAPYAPNIAVRPEKGGHSITFVHLGRKYYQITLWANTYVSQRKWVESITKQQEAMRERSSIFDMTVLNEGFFVGMTKVKCAAPFRKFKKRRARLT